MEADIQQRVKFLRDESSDGDSGNENRETEKPINEEDIEFSPPANVEEDKGRPAFRPIFFQRLAYYPYTWKGPAPYLRKISDIYGLIICVHDQTCYILNSFGVHTYRPKYLKPNDKNLVGCWVSMELTKDESRIASTPDFSKNPLQTRVFYDDEGMPSLLIYDYVKIIDESTLESKFLGQIENNCVDLSYTTKLWCNIEYTITVNFKHHRFTYICEAVKFHGSMPIHSGLPEILSYIPDSDHKASMISDRFHEAFFDPKEIAKKREERVQKERDRLIRRNAHAMAFLNDKQEEAIEPKATGSEANEPKANEQIQEEDTNFEDDEYFNQAIDRSQQSSSQSQPTQMNMPPPIRSRPVPIMKQSSSTANEEKAQKVVFITYAAAGYSLRLARYYLDNGHKIIAHVVDRDADKKIRALTNDNTRLAIAYGPIDESLFAGMKEEHLTERFGEIDIVFHFASAICKPGRDHGSYEQLRYLFEEDVKPLAYIYKYLTDNGQSHFNRFKLIVVGPIYNPKAIKPKLLPNIECFMSYLRLTIDEISRSHDPSNVLTFLVRPNELISINPVQQGNAEAMCRTFYENERDMNFD